MRTQRISTTTTQSIEASDLDRRINLLIQRHPELIDSDLMWSKEVIKDSEELSKEIIDSFRERLKP